MNEAIEKRAHDLARRAVHARKMRKTARDGEADASSILRPALMGSLIGGAGTGLISALSGRRRGSLLRDLVLGALVGGAGGAAYPFAEETISDVVDKIKGAGGGFPGLPKFGPANVAAAAAGASTPFLWQRWQSGMPLTAKPGEPMPGLMRRIGSRLRTGKFFPKSVPGAWAPGLPAWRMAGGAVAANLLLRAITGASGD